MLEVKKFGKLISDLRRKKQMTQEELGKELHVSSKAVSKWESGKGYPESTQFPVLAEFFDVSIDYLMTGEDKRKIEVRSNLEDCAMRDDPKLLENLNVIHAIDEKGHNLAYYIKKYESLNVLNYVIDINKQHSVNLTNALNGFSKEDIIYFALVLNRLDFIRQMKIPDIKQLASVDEEEWIKQNQLFGKCILTDKIFETIVGDKISASTLDYLLTPEGIAENYWTWGFSYILDKAYQTNNKSLFNRLLSLIENDNEKKIKIYETKTQWSKNEGFYTFQRDRFFTVTRILESTIIAALRNQDYENVERLNKVNKGLLSLNSSWMKCYTASKDDIVKYKALKDPKILEIEKKYPSVIVDGLVDIPKLIALKDFDVYKELIVAPAVKPYKLSFSDIQDFSDIRFFREAYKFDSEKSSVDNALTYVVEHYPERYNIQQFLLEVGAHLHKSWIEDDGWGYVVNHYEIDEVATTLLRNQLEILNKNEKRE